MPRQTRKFLVLFAVLTLVMFTASSGHVLAQSQPTNAANKTHVSASVMEVFGPSTNVTLMSTSMKTSANADLILAVSCECAISVNDVDNTFSHETDSALVVVKVWVEVDGVAVAVDPNAATPDDGRVIFCRRDSSNATSQFGSGFTQHQFEATRAAHAFNWFARNVGAGVHIVEVKAQVQHAASSFGGAFGFSSGVIVPVVQGAVGRRTLIVEPVLPGK